MPYDALRKGRVSLSNQAYFITTVTRARYPHFREFRLAAIVARELLHLHRTGQVDSLAWVLMPDHLHWLFATRSIELSDIVRIFKGRTGHRVNRACRGRGPLWQRSFYDHAVRAEEDLCEIARYIVANPLRAGIVRRLGDYPFWNAIWL